METSISESESAMTTKAMAATEAATEATEQREVLSRLREIERALAARPFRQHRLFRNAHAQTLAAWAWPRRFDRRGQTTDEERLFEIEPGVRLLAHCRWQPERTSCPALVLLHGLEGSSASPYILGTARLAAEAGFNVVRLNQRNCGATEHLTPTLYHSGLSGDLKAVINDLIARDGLTRIFVAGFSLGGNLALKLAGELGAQAPPELRGLCAVSPSLDLSASVAHIDRPANWLYRANFMRSLRRRIRLKHKLFPALYDTGGLRSLRTLRAFDSRYTARHGGFASADDYYARSSALPLVKEIRVPTLIIHAEDDPLVPSASFRQAAISANPYVISLLPKHGGHVGFLAATDDERQRFWAEHTLVRFCRLIDDARAEDRR